MKLKGGYNVSIEGRPSGKILVLPEPEMLHLPLSSRRFRFSEVCVEEGERVGPGRVLARDPESYFTPMLAPRAGTVKLSEEGTRITLEDVAKADEEPYHPDEDLAHLPKEVGPGGEKRKQLLDLGAWQFMYDAHTGALPDPFGTPRAVIVSTLHLDPFVARGDVQMRKRLTSFTRGLEHIQSLLEYQPIHLVVPHVQSKFAAKVREILRGYAFVQTAEVPLKYPYDNFAVLARGLGFKREEDEPVWALGVAGVLAIDRALTLSLPSTVRIISIGGPAVEGPQHLRAMPGYPLRSILEAHVKESPVRVINGGVLTGAAVSSDEEGLDVECQGITVLHEAEEREFMGFVRPGADRQSYSRCFLSSLRGAFPERLTTAQRGEGRACVACGYCEEVCPAGIMPHLIHKYLYQDALEEAERARADLCVECGLCSFVCPSKIELTKQLIEAQETIRQELHPENANE